MSSMGCDAPSEMKDPADVAMAGEETAHIASAFQSSYSGWLCGAPKLRAVRASRLWKCRLLRDAIAFGDG